jgi:hypothetical protein
MALKGYNVAATADTTGTWTGATNVFTSNNSDASITANNTDFLRVKNFNFNIPTNAIIRGIEISVEGEGDNATGSNRELSIDITKNGTDGTGTPKTLQLPQSTDGIVTAGGATDLWGVTLGIDVEEVNASTFGVRIAKTTTTGTVNIDQVVLRVYFDNGIRGEWDVDFDDIEITKIDGYLDYDTGSGGTTPADGDVIYDQTTGTTAVVIGLGSWNVLAFGTFVLGDVHHGTGAFGNNNTIEVLDYVNFDTESNGGFSESDIGSTFTTSGSGTRTGIIRHIFSNGSTGRMWFTTSSGTAIADNDALQISATTRALANGAEVSNAWTGLNNGTLIQQAQGYLDYDGETTLFEASSGLGRVRDKLGFQHNMCIHGTTSNATAMIVDDREDPNATDTGRLYLVDISGTFSNNETINALDEIDYDGETNGGFYDLIGAVINGQTSGATATVRRVIDNGTTGTIYLSNISGTFQDNENLRRNSDNQVRAVANGTLRNRFGSALVNGTLTSARVQWLASHLYSDAQDQFDELLALDDKVPMSAQVLDQQYTAVNTWLVPFYSTRRLKKGAINEIGTLGGNDDDSVFTNYFHLGSLKGSPELYVQQGTNNVLTKFWDDGSMDVLLRNKNKNSLVQSGTVTWYARPFGDLYDHFAISAVGLRNPIPLNTSADLNNVTSEGTMNSTQTYHNIRVMFASHLLAFDTGTGTASVGDVVFNTTTNQAAMICRIPASFTSGSDMHLASNGVSITGWGDNQTLDLLDYVDFDAQVSQFVVGEAVENQTDSWNATVRFVQQYGATRGRIWFSGASGSLADNDTIRLNGAGATRATANGTPGTANTWTALTNGVPPTTADNTVLKDIGQGGDQPYNVVIDANGATILQVYEMLKFITRQNAGDVEDPGTLLYPNNISTQGRLYQKADSTYGAADTVKASPFGTFAGGKFFGARGIFVEDMASGDVQNYSLIDANGTTRTPPNYQGVTVSGLSVGDRVAVFRRSRTTGSFTYNDNGGSGDSVITRGSGDFVDEGFVAGSRITVSDTTSNNNTFSVKTATATTLTLTGIVLVDEGPVASTIIGDNVNKDQFTGHATNNNSGDGTFDVVESLPTDLPASGTLIVVSVNGSEIYEDIYSYTTYSGSAFTISGTLVRTYDSTARAYVPLIYKTAASSTESQTIIYSSDFSIKSRVRKKGILPFEVDGTFTSTGASVAAIRTTDTIVE